MEELNLKDGQIVLIIDTDVYSGNHEREMCSALTGYNGEFFTSDCS